MNVCNKIKYSQNSARKLQIENETTENVKRSKDSLGNTLDNILHITTISV